MHGDIDQGLVFTCRNTSPVSANARAATCPGGFDEGPDLDVLSRRPRRRQIIRSLSLSDLDAIAQSTDHTSPCFAYGRGVLVTSPIGPAW